VSFLATDSTGGHKTGDPFIWRNTITLKHKLWQADGDMMLELRAAPLAPIRYSTEGSDPRNHGASYEGEFVVPQGTRLVLAVGEKQGVCSEVLRLDIDWTRPPEAKPIDREAAATWRPGEPFRFSETHKLRLCESAKEIPGAGVRYSGAGRDQQRQVGRPES